MFLVILYKTEVCLPNITIFNWQGLPITYFVFCICYFFVHGRVRRVSGSSNPTLAAETIIIITVVFLTHCIALFYFDANK